MWEWRQLLVRVRRAQTDHWPGWEPGQNWEIPGARRGQQCHHQLSALPDNTCHSGNTEEHWGTLHLGQSTHTWRCWLILIEEQNTGQDNALSDTADMMEKVGSGEGVMRWNMVARGERGETVSWWIIEVLQTCDRDKTVSREAVSDRAKKFKKDSSLSFV